ncbi:MAG: tetratricopeptide repeat protein [Bacteroidales bacterium]|nr:tetratricopeptide repeat protein [Bacteroidales bacterium]MDE7072763.1 tetratricopeptide repeat protein [Bacteroidales bacterium]
MAEKVEKGEQVVEDVEVALVKTGDFFEKHRSLIIGIVAVIVVLVVGYFGVKYLYIAPKEKTAAEEMFVAQRYFEMDSLSVALNGDGQHAGMLEIADRYSLTKSGKLANYYAGLAYLHQGHFEDAVAYLKKFRTKDPVLFILSCQVLGDAYMELDQPEKALEAYSKGISKYPNEVLTPALIMRTAMVHESLQQYGKALSLYQSVRDQFPASREASDIERYIARMNAKLGK